MVDLRNSKKEEKTFKVRWIYQSIGISKQAYSQRLKADLIRDSEKEKVIAWVIEYRKKLPKTGTCKLYEYLTPILKENHIKMGRNALNDLLRNTGMLVKKTKRFHITTDSKHFYYKSSNLLINKEITHSEQVFVSDITYVKTDEGHAYLALVTDAYSRKIMGWSLENNRAAFRMKVSMVKDALAMAHRKCTFKHEYIIHHSDRGIQYCCPDYTQFVENKGFILSTTQQYDPYENAIAERINGILKYEFGLKNTIKSVELAKKMTAQAVTLYNNERMHWSLDFKKPEEVHLAYNLHPNKNYKKEVKSNLKT